MRTVADVMTRDVISASPDTPYKEVLRRLAEFRISGLPVVDAEGRLLGLISEADLLLKEELGPRPQGSLAESERRRDERHKARGSRAADLMTTPVWVASPTVEAAEAARRMRVRGVRRAPVVDEDGRVVGMLCRRDLLGAFLRDDAEIRDEIRELLERTLLYPDRVQVEVADGVVTLIGEVARGGSVPRLLRLLEAVRGVVQIRYRLGWEPEAVEWMASPVEPEPAHWSRIGQGPTSHQTVPLPFANRAERP